MRYQKLFLLICLAANLFITTHPSSANPIDLEGKVILIEEKVDIRIGYNDSSINGVYLFKQRKAHNKLQYDFNLFFPTYRPIESKEPTKLFINYGDAQINSSVVSKLDDIHSDIIDNLNRSCPKHCQIDWFKSENISGEHLVFKQSARLKPISISYSQLNYNDNGSKYFIYTPIYTRKKAWGDSTYIVKIKPKNYVIKIEADESLNIDLVSEHNNYSKKDNGIYIIHPFKFDQKNKNSDVQSLFLSMKPVIIKITKKMSNNSLKHDARAR